MSADRIDFSRYCVISIWFGCNNRCPICMLGSVKKELAPTSYDGFRKVLIDVMREGRFQNLILSGAEVTTFEALERFVRFAASLESADNFSLYSASLSYGSPPVTMVL